MLISKWYRTIVSCRPIFQRQNLSDGARLQTSMRYRRSKPLGSRVDKHEKVHPHRMRMQERHYKELPEYKTTTDKVSRSTSVHELLTPAATAAAYSPKPQPFTSLWTDFTALILPHLALFTRSLTVSQNCVRAHAP